MIDFRVAQVRTHRRNIRRYSRLLATELTDSERQYVHKRLAEEYAQLERLELTDEGNDRGGSEVPRPGRARRANYG